MLVIGMMLSFVHRFDSLAAVCINNAQRIVFTFNPYLLISRIHLLISRIHLLISRIHLLISRIHLLISRIHLLISIKMAPASIFIDINK